MTCCGPVEWAVRPLLDRFSRLESRTLNSVAHSRTANAAQGLREPRTSWAKSSESAPHRGRGWEAVCHESTHPWACLLYTSDAADEEDSVDLGGRRIIKKKKK